MLLTSHGRLSTLDPKILFWEVSSHTNPGTGHPILASPQICGQHPSYPGAASGNHLPPIVVVFSLRNEWARGDIFPYKTWGEVRRPETDQFDSHKRRDVKEARSPSPFPPPLFTYFPHFPRIFLFSHPGQWGPFLHSSECLPVYLKPNFSPPSRVPFSGVTSLSFPEPRDSACL